MWEQQSELSCLLNTKDMNYKLVFIDDHMREGVNDPFVRPIGKKNKDAEISVFLDPTEGLQYVMDNLNSRMIVFIDRKFDGYTLQGINLLKEIRKTTSLLYIVMMSVSPLAEIPETDIQEMINEDYISFFNRNTGTIDEACRLIQKVKDIWYSRFDCILEAWLVRHPEEANKQAYTEACRSYTWKDILSELRMQTPAGKGMEQMVNEYYMFHFGEEKDK